MSTSTLDFIITLIVNSILPFILGGVVVGSIVRAMDNRTIRDLKVLLQGFGVLREERPRWFWPKLRGISFGRK